MMQILHIILIFMCKCR